MRGVRPLVVLGREIREMDARERRRTAAVVWVVFLVGLGLALKVLCGW